MKPLSVIRGFLASSSAGGLVLMAAAALAIAIANSPLAPHYFAARELHFGALSLIDWINDGAMALFFLLVGLEIKRELIEGQLSTWERRRLPGLAAAAGMVVPALIYVAVNRHDAAALRGWAIPAATDIAFALGVLALLGRRVPASLKLLLTAIAVIDDMGAVAIIAAFYTDAIDWAALAAAVAILAGLWAATRAGLRVLWPFLLAAPFLWWAMHASGVHATIAGVALAAVIPLHGRPGRVDDATSPLVRLEHGLAPWVGFLVVPLFGFANAGLALGEVRAADLAAGVPLGIALGLFVGKQAGILGAVWFAVRTGLARLPAGARWVHVHGMAAIAGIGFTMSLFVGGLAFDRDHRIEDMVKLGVLVGSLTSALVGVALLRAARMDLKDRRR